ncbi:MAG: hypothetical protein P1U40_11665 [Coxiellaceae bacterium]|nr:hypothetical protein [Coxiellaceae bacterium]
MRNQAGAAFDKVDSTLPISGKSISSKPSKSHKKSIKKITELVEYKLPMLVVGDHILAAIGFGQDVFVPLSLDDSEYQVYCTPQLWSGSNALAKAQLEEKSAIKLDTIVSGSCLFGDHLVGTANTGESIVMTNTEMDLPEGVVIESVAVKAKHHAYELMTHLQLDLMWPILKVISSDDVTLQFHLPVPEYILFGIELYHSGKMTLVALQSYITAVVEKGYAHKMLLNAFKLMNGCHVVVSSPLDCLGLDTLKTMPLGELGTAVSCINVDTLYDDLSRFAHWSVMMAADPAVSLSDIGHQSYVAHVAMHAHDALTTAVFDNFNEKTICRKYTKLFPEAPTVLGFHYLPAFAPDNAKACWYHADKHEVQLQKLVRTGKYKQATLKGFHHI